MGNTILTPQASSQILNKYWEPIGSNLFRNKATQQIIKQKKLTFRTEDQMKYVFNCLLKRMNNYNPNVIKIVYLRKLNQTSSLCQCGKKFIILVYIENVEFKLKNFISNNQGFNFKNSSLKSKSYQHKCACLHLLKGAQYLKERYGAFRVGQNNCWIQTLTKSHQIVNQSIKQTLNQDKSEQIQNYKIKVWISSQAEQNFPDQSCEQKQMCLSIIQLIQHTLVPSKLCGCYNSAQVLDKYLNIPKLKDLQLNIKQDHQKLFQRYISPQIVERVQKQQPHFQRTIRSFSSTQSGHQPIFYPHVICQRTNEIYRPQVTQRKYTSIEYARKPNQQLSMTVNKKLSRSPFVFNEINNIVAQPQKLYLNQQQKAATFQSARNHQNSFKSDHSINKNQNKMTFKFYEAQNLNYQKNPINLQQLRGAQVFNSKIKYRHGENIYNRPIIEIADMQTQQTNKIPVILMSNNYQINSNKKPQSPVYQIPTDRDNTQKQESYEQQICDVSKIDLSSNPNKKYFQISLDKGTNPTDRTKFQISSKGQQKKQGEAINSSRKNISIIPISLDSTYGASSSLKPILYSYDHLHKNASPAEPDFQMLTKKQSIHIFPQNKSKKQSASSSKSQQNYTTHQINLSNSNKNEQMETILIKKRMSDQHEPSGSRSSQRHAQFVQPTRQKAHSFINKIQTLGLTTVNGDIGRLRQSQYLISAQNSFMNSKTGSRKQSNDYSENIYHDKPITSLAQMQAKFKTRNDIQQPQHYQAVQQNSDRVQQKYQSTQKVSSNNMHQLAYSEHRSSHHSKVNEENKSNYNSSHSISNNQLSDKLSNNLFQHQHHISDKVSSLIVRQQQEPLIHLNYNEEEYSAKIGLQQCHSIDKVHQKTLSNPIFDKNQMSKNKSLKEEFGHLLDFPKQNSFKALTQSKDKMLTLDQNQGRETYSIYNQSEYNASDQVSKGQSQKQIAMGSSNPPLPHKQHGKHGKWRKPFSKNDLQKEMNQKRQATKLLNQGGQQMLRLTSSGHEDNSIKQKVRNKKAQFAQLKNQMNSLLL